MLTRRRLLLGLAASSCVACRRTPPSRTETKFKRWREFEFAASSIYSERQYAAVLLRKDKPLLIALHGRGEAGRGLKQGARGWRDDYELNKADRRLAKPPLTQTDFYDLVEDKRLGELNTSLQQRPYQGLAVVCPYTPALPDRSLAGSAAYARFLTEAVIPRARDDWGMALSREQCGIDGVSMGGRLALLIGLAHPTYFRAVGALQPAISSQEAPWLSELAARAVSQNPMALRLVSSHGDPFLPAVKALSRRLDQDRVAHQFLITPGPHAYIWNRGPGSFEMLLWHDRVLRGLSAA